MATSAPKLDQATEVTLRTLADIATPAPVSWMPQTWGWALLTAVAFGAVLWGCWQWRNHLRANRYRRVATKRLTELEQLVADPNNTQQVLEEVSVLLKRVALAAWPRERVATLHGGKWVQFLQASDNSHKLNGGLVKLLDDLEYRPDHVAGEISRERIKELMISARTWIEHHNVSA